MCTPMTLIYICSRNNCLNCNLCSYLCVIPIWHDYVNYFNFDVQFRMFSMLLCVSHLCMLSMLLCVSMFCTLSILLCVSVLILCFCVFQRDQGLPGCCYSIHSREERSDWCSSCSHLLRGRHLLCLLPLVVSAAWYPRPVCAVWEPVLCCVHGWNGGCTEACCHQGTRYCRSNNNNQQHNKTSAGEEERLNGRNK